MDERACPSVDEIRDFLNEQLVPARDQEVSLHIQECPSCSELMTTVADSDETQNNSDLLPVLAEIRTLQNDQGFEAEDGCLQAVERARQIPEQSSNSAIDSGSNDTDSRAAPPSKLGPYELGDEIGTGGMGSVYRATHSKLGRTVAVKVLHGRRLNHPAAIARFEREMKAVGQLEHPNIVRATDADEDDGVQYLVMEYLDGVDLSSLVRQRGRLPVAEACELVRQAALGLQHAHENGFVHRDIKPANLMLCGADDAERRATVAPHSMRKAPGTGGCVKILDLGLAQLENPTDEEALTSTGQAVGTIEYMAPEQIDETQQVDIRADIYSLGATLYKLLTGQSPLENGQARSRLQKLKALANDESPAITDLRNDLPATLVEVIGRMLSRSPDDRYATPQEVAEALLPHTKNANLAEMIHSLGPVVDSKTVLPGKAARNLQSATTKLRVNLPRWGAFAALAIVVVIVIIQKNSTSTESDPEPPPPAVARRTSIRLEDRTLIFEDQYESADQITVRSDGQTLTLLRKNAVFTADIGYGDATHAFSIRTTEFDGLQLLLSAGDDYVTLEDVSGINGDLKIDGGEGEDRIDVSGKVSLGRHSLAASIDSVLFFKDTALSATEHGSIDFNATQLATGVEDRDRILLNPGSVIRTELGDITLIGDMSNQMDVPGNGVNLDDSTVETVSGNITIRGRASQGAGASHLMGVRVHDGATVRSTGTGGDVGRIILDGIGGKGGRNHNGVEIYYGSIESMDAAIEVTGIGVSGRRTVLGFVLSHSSVKSRRGDIMITGTGGTGELGNDGVLLIDDSILSSQGGNIRITGTAGAASESHGVYLFTGAVVDAQGGNITISGHGGEGREDGHSCPGVKLVSGARITTTGNGNISIDGVGGRASGRQGNENNVGIDFGSQEHSDPIATVQATQGAITLQGQGGLGVSSGVLMRGHLLTSNGSVSVIGEGSDGAPDLHWQKGVVGGDDAVGNVTLAADSLSIEGGAIRTSGNVVVHPRSDTYSLTSSSEPQGANYLKLSDWSLFSSTVSDLTVRDSRGHGWRRRISNAKPEWFELDGDIEPRPLSTEPSVAISRQVD